MDNSRSPRAALKENDIKVLLDGNRLRVVAWVDSKGLKRLKKILDANEVLIENEESDGQAAAN